MATGNGHVYAFHEPFHGSLAGKHLSSAVVGIAGNNKGGYWLVTANGQVSAFGAPIHGSVKHPNGRVVGIAADKSGTGYWVVTSNGHVYAFNAANRGGARASGVVGIAADLAERRVLDRDLEGQGVRLARRQLQRQDPSPGSPASPLTRSARATGW